MNYLKRCRLLSQGECLVDSSRIAIGSSIQALLEDQHEADSLLREFTIDNIPTCKANLPLKNENEKFAAIRPIETEHERPLIDVVHRVNEREMHMALAALLHEPAELQNLPGYQVSQKTYIINAYIN